MKYKLQCCNSGHLKVATNSDPFSIFKNPAETPKDSKKKKKKVVPFNRFGFNQKNVWRRPVLDKGLPKKINIAFIDECIRLSDELGLPSDTIKKKMTNGVAKDASPLTWEKFFQQEEHCYAINQLLSHSEIACDSDGEYLVFPRLSGEIERLLDLAVEEINKIITLDWEVANRIYLGPGNATTCGSMTDDPLDKFDQQCWAYPNKGYRPEEFFCEDVANYIKRKSCGVAPDKILEVPKNCTVNRTIGVGTVVGIASQHVCGQYIRRCMQRHGIDLRVLADEHKEIAWLGSVKDRYQTIDFSMASDSLSVGLISRLLGGKHSSYRVRTLYKKLLNCRAAQYEVAGKTFDYYKHSAMGNASTFELETLVFMALGRAITKMHYLKYFKWYFVHRHKPRLATSYGDDLILDLLVTEGTKTWVVNLLAHVGLQVNEEKSFFSGDFRESCGGDYRLGRNIRGLYLHKTVVRIPDVIRTFNFFHVCHGVPLKDLLAREAFAQAYDYYQLKLLHGGEAGNIDPFKPILYDSTLMMDDLNDRRSFGYIIRKLKQPYDKECISLDDVFMFLDSGSFDPDFTPRFRPGVYVKGSDRPSFAFSNATDLELNPLIPLVRMKEETSGYVYKRAVLSANGREARI